MALKRSTCI